MPVKATLGMPMIRTVDAKEIMSDAAVADDRDSILSSLDALLSSMDIETDELRSKQDLESGYAEQIASMERQRTVVAGLITHQDASDELVSKMVTDVFWNLLLESSDHWEVRNDKMLGLYRSSAAMTMKKDWGPDSPSATDWVESFVRSIARRRKEVLSESTNNNRLVKLSHLTTLQVEEELYLDPQYAGAPKEYWRQYAAFKLIGSVLNSRQSSMDLAAEMAPAFEVLRLATA